MNAMRKISPENSLPLPRNCQKKNNRFHSGLTSMTILKVKIRLILELTDFDMELDEFIPIMAWSFDQLRC